MKRNITKFLAALALLVFTMPSLVAWGQTRTRVVYDFSEIPGFDQWESSYSQHVVEYDEATVTFTSANKNTQTITDIPVTKGQPVSLVLNETTNSITSATFVCRQWGTKAQTITLHYSTDGGSNYTSTNITSTNFTISSNSLPEGTNAVKITFSSASNQVGIESATINIEASSSNAVATQVTIDATGITNTDVHTSTEAGSLSATVSANGEAISGATVAWSSSNTDVATIDANGVVTLVAAGTTTITAAYAGVEGQYLSSSATYQLEVTDSTPFSGGDVTFVCGVDMSETMSLSKNGVTMEFEASGGTWSRTDNYRLYSGKSMTISTTSGTITQIVFTISQNNFSGDGYDSDTKTWTGNASTITLAADGGQVRFTPVVVTVNLNATPDPAITANNVNIAYNATGGEITYAIENPVDDASLEAVVAEGATISNFELGTVGASPITFTCTANTEGSAHTATVTLNYVKNGETLATKDVTVTQAAAPMVYNSIEALFNAATSTETDVIVGFDGWVVTGVKGSQAFVSDGTNGLIIYQSGHGFEAGNTLTGTISCRLVLYYGAAELKGITSTTEGLTVGEGGSVTPQVLTASQMTNGIKTGAVVTFENLAYDGTGFSDGTNTITVKTDMYDYSNDVESGNSYSITGVYEHSLRIYPRSADDIVEVEVQHEEYTLTIGNPDHITITANYDEEVLNNGEYAEVLDGTEVTFVVTVASGYVLESVTVVDANQEAVTFTETSGVYTFNMPASDVTINATATEYVAPTGDEYELYSGALVEGDYVIYYNGSAMKNTVQNGRLYYETVTPNDDVIITDDATIVWHIAPSGDYWTIYSADANAYAAGTGVKSKAQMLADGTDDKAMWTVTGSETYNFVNKANAYANVNAYLRNNKNTTENYGFACYAEGTGGPLSLYKKAESAPESYTLTINGYTNDNAKTGYYLIASPVTVDIADVQGLTDGTFDLYSYDDSQSLEWINYEPESGSTHPFTTLEPGKGYLYAKKATTEGETFSFTLSGTPYEGEGEIGLTTGWNLVGNPFGVEAEISMDYYAVNPSTTELISTAYSTNVAALQGVFVNNAGGASSVIFMEASTGTGNGDSHLSLNVMKNRGNLIDRAIVRFGEGSQLPKFQLNPNSTKIYVTEGNQDFAIVRSANEGEMPVSFKASENGTYTLAVETENMEMDYLHLIDNMTGMDVDLLQTPSYTFEASTRDHANRFRLVFSGAENGASTGSASFAYYNGTSWTVSNLGEATLQVVDVMGRLVSSETINGNATINLNETAGIYMLRLVNGNDVKVQKIVVR